jgi:hypothetical protein
MDMDPGLYGFGYTGIHYDNQPTRGKLMGISAKIPPGPCGELRGIKATLGVNKLQGYRLRFRWKLSDGD